MYSSIFKLSINRALAYRFDFFIGRVKNIVVMLLLYYVWKYLSGQSNAFAGYSESELLTYVFGMNVLRAFVLGTQSRKIAQEINEGTFSSYLIKPLSPWRLFYFRELGEKILNTLTAMVEVIIFSLILNIQFVIPHAFLTLLLFFFSVLAAHILYFFLSILVNSLAFWTREAMGPRFLFEWILEFSSGAYFPIDILKETAALVLRALPFMYLLFIPMQIFLERIPLNEAIFTFFIQILWVIAIGTFTSVVWKAGLKKYSSEGI